MKRRWSSRDSTNVTSAHTWSARGPQLASAPLWKSSCASLPSSHYPPPHRPRANQAQRLPRLRPECVLRRLPSALLMRNLGSERAGRWTSGWDVAGLPLALPDTVQARGRQARGWGKGVLWALPPSHATSSPCVAAPSPKAPWELQDAREEALYRVGTPPSTPWLEGTQPPHSGVACPDAGKAPSPFPSNTLTCVRAQFSRSTRPFRARPSAPPCTLPAAAAAAGPLGSRRPPPACAPRRGVATSRDAQVAALPPPGAEL